MKAKKLNLGEMYRIVRDTPKMFEEYCKRLSESSIQYSRGNNKVRGKRVGIRRLDLAQKYIAASVYRDFNVTQSNLFEA